MSSLKMDETTQLVLVVGYDGSEPAERALTGAAEMLRDRPGRMEVVYVAHMPGTVAFSAGAVVAVQEGMDSQEHELATRVDETLGGTGLKWHFQRRNGEIAPSLLAACQEQLDAEGPSTASCWSSADPLTKSTATSTRHRPASSARTGLRCTWFRRSSMAPRHPSESPATAGIR